MPIEEMNALLEKLNQPGATVDTVADDFVANRQAVWQRWVGDAGPASASNGASGGQPGQ
jgi:glycine betaine/proline transport system substrate-binding protein